MRVPVATAIGDWLPKLGMLLVLTYLANQLGPADYAPFAVAVALLNSLWIAVSAGTTGYGLRRAADHRSPPHDMAGEVLALNVAAALVATALLVVVADVLVEAADLRRALLWMSPFLVAYALFPDWYLRGRGALRALAAGNWALLGAFCLGLLVAGPDLGAARIGLLWALAPLGAAAVTWWSGAMQGVSLRRGADHRRWWRHLWGARRFAVAGLLANVGVPLTLYGLTLVAPRAVLGSFAFGLRLAMVCSGALWTLVLNLLPSLVASPRRHIAARHVVTVLSVATAVWLVAAVATVVVGVRVLGESYHETLWWVVAGEAVIVPLASRLVVEGLLLAAFLDRERVLVAALGPMGAAAGVVLGLALGSGAVVIAGLVLGEAAAAASGWWLHRTRATGAPTTTDAGRLAAAMGMT